MESFIASVKGLSHAEQDRLIMALLSSRYASSTTSSEAPKPAKKGRKPKAVEAVAEAVSSSSEAEKPKRVVSEGMKAWTTFVFKVRDLVRSSTAETNFPYKNSLSIASALKKADNTGASDAVILEAYRAYRLEHPPSDSESSAPLAPSATAHVVSPPSAVTTTPERPTAVKKAPKAPKKKAPFKGLWEFEGVTYERDDAYIFSVSGEWVGLYNEKLNTIDRSAPAPELSYD